MLVVLDSIAMTSAFELGRLVRDSENKPFAGVISDAHFTAMMAALSPLWVVLRDVRPLPRAGAWRPRARGGPGHRRCDRRRHAADLGRHYSFKERSSRAIRYPLFALLIGIPLVILERQVVPRRHALDVRQWPRLAQRDLDRHRPTRRPIQELTKPERVPTVAAVGGRTNGYAWSADAGLPTLESIGRGFPGWRVDEIVQAEVDFPPARPPASWTSRHSAGELPFVPDKYDMYAAASEMTTLDGCR